MELGAAIEEAVSAPPPVDEDFYDDIVVEAARNEPTVEMATTPASPAPKPAAEPPVEAGASPASRSDDDDLFEVTVDAEDENTQVSTRESRASDPDRTPLPIAEGADELGGAAAGARHAARRVAPGHRRAHRAAARRRRRAARCRR